MVVTCTAYPICLKNVTITLIYSPDRPKGKRYYLTFAHKTNEIIDIIISPEAAEKLFKGLIMVDCE